MKALKQIKSALIILLFTGAIAAFSACKESTDESDGSFWNPEILGEWYNPHMLYFNDGISFHSTGKDIYITFEDSTHLSTRYYYYSYRILDNGEAIYYEPEIKKGPSYIYTMTKDRILIYEAKSHILESPIFNIQYKVERDSLILAQYGKLKFPNFNIEHAMSIFLIDNLMIYTKVGN